MSLSLTLKVQKNGRMVSVVQSRRKLSFLQRIKAKLNQEGVQFYLRVKYSDDFFNDGYFQDKNSLLQAYRCFTEDDLVKEFQQ